MFNPRFRIYKNHRLPLESHSDNAYILSTPLCIKDSTKEIFTAEL